MAAFTKSSSSSTFLAYFADAARAALSEWIDTTAPVDARTPRPTLLLIAAIMWSASASAVPDGAMSNLSGTLTMVTLPVTASLSSHRNAVWKTEMPSLVVASCNAWIFVANWITDRLR